LFKAIDLLFGLRVTEEEEIIGLDIGEHEMESYAGFQIFSAE
jgi:Amt family ammonium transporter